MKNAKKHKSKLQYTSIIWMLLGILVMSSCSRRPYYTAKNSHTMTLNEKGDMAVSAVADIDIMSDQSLANEHQVSLQAAYSPLQHLVVSSNTNFIFPKSKDTVYRKGFDYDFAVGTYFSFDYQPNRMDTEGETILLEAYLSVGQGRFSNFQSIVQGRSINYNRYGTQLGLYYQSIDEIYYSVGLVYRPTILEYSKLNLIGDFDEVLLNELTINNRRRIDEISINWKIGVEKFTVYFNCYTIQEGGDFKLGLADNNGLQLGVIFNIDAFLRGD